MTPRVIPIVIVIAALVVGCTSGEDSSAPSSAASPSSTEAVGPTTTGPGSDENEVVTVPEGVGGEAIGPLGSTQLRVETDEGTVQIGSGSVPERLASGFPLPSDFVVQLASETSTDLGFSGTSDLAFDELVELYESGLPEAGYVIVSVDRSGSEFAVFEFRNDLGVGQVAISNASGTAAHTVIVAFGDGDRSEPEN